MERPGGSQTINLQPTQTDKPDTKKCCNQNLLLLYHPVHDKHPVFLERIARCVFMKTSDSSWLFALQSSGNTGLKHQRFPLDILSLLLLSTPCSQQLAIFNTCVFFSCTFICKFTYLVLQNNLRFTCDFLENVFTERYID